MRTPGLLVGAVLLCTALPLAAENDGSVCSLPGVPFCRALETAVAGPRLNGSTVDGGFATWPSIYFDGGNLYLSAHAFFWPNWSPPGLSRCNTVLGPAHEVGALWVKPAVSASNITQPFTFVQRNTPCCSDISCTADPVKGQETGGGGNGTEIEKGYNDLYYTIAATYYELLPLPPDAEKGTPRKGCTFWNEGCFPGLYIGAHTTPTGFPSYMAARLLSIYTHNGETRGFQGIRVAPFNEPGIPDPPTAVFPRQLYNGTPALFFGYVSWGKVPGHPGNSARIQIVDVPDGQVRPHWSSTRIFMVDAAGTWRLVPTGGRPDFVPETLVDTTGNSDYFTTPSPFYDPDWGWRFATNRDFLPADGSTGCNEAQRLSGKMWAGTEHGNSTVAHRAVDSTHAFTLAHSTSTTNGLQLGLEIFRIPGGGPQWYVARGSTERICFGTETWWHPFFGAEITIEKLP